MEIYLKVFIMLKCLKAESLGLLEILNNGNIGQM